MANQTTFGGSVDNDEQVLQGTRPEYDGDGGGALSADGDGVRSEYSDTADGVVKGTNATF